MALPALALGDDYARRINETVAGEVRAAMGRRHINQTQLGRALDMSQFLIVAQARPETVSGAKPEVGLRFACVLVHIADEPDPKSCA